MLKTQIVQPIYHSNQRTEFRVGSKGKVLLPNLRLCNFGISAITAGGAAPGTMDTFGFAGGCLSLIKNIVLYSGNVILDQITDADQWLGISNMITSAPEARDLKQKLLCSNLNILSLDDGDLRHSITFQLLEGKLLGRVNLQDVFPFLNAQITGPNKQPIMGEDGSPMTLDYLPDFDDLRLVIEYHTAANHIFAAPNITAPNGRPTAWTVSQPELVYEEVVDEEFAAEIMKYRPVRYVVRAIERERLDLTQNGSVRLRAFDGKQLYNLVMQTISDNTSDPQLCYAYSTLQPGEKMQLVVNGRKLLPFQGADSAARKSALFSDTLESFISFTGSTDINFGNRDAKAAAPVFAPRPAAMIGDLSFLGVSILDTVSQLELEYQNSTAYAAPIQIWAWGEVFKYVLKDKSTGMLETGYVSANSK